jgi:hypothetical protein
LSSSNDINASRFFNPAPLLGVGEGAIRAPIDWIKRFKLA